MAPKVLLVHNYYKSKMIGGEDVVFQNEKKHLLNILGKHNVFFYTVCNDDIKLKNLIFDIWFSHKHYRNIKKIVQENNINAVHVHNFFPLLSPSVFLGAKKGGAKVVLTLHNYRLWCLNSLLFKDGVGICEICPLNSYFNGVRSKCFRDSYLLSIYAQAIFGLYRVLRLYNSVDTFIVLSDFQRRKVIDFGISPERIEVRPNGINMVENRFIQKNKKDYLFVGRLEEGKGILDLLSIWKDLEKSYILRIIGKGPLESQVKGYLSENIIYLGRQEQDEVIRIMAGSRFLIQPSLYYETFGLTIIESFSVGTPVISYDIGPRKELIKDKKNGFLVNNRDELLQVIKKSKEYNEYDLLSFNAEKTAERYYYHNLIEKQITIYD